MDLYQKYTVVLDEIGAKTIKDYFYKLSLTEYSKGLEEFSFKAGDEYTAELWQIMVIFDKLEG